MKVAVIGAGSWGTTIAHLCSQNADTSVWTRRPEVVESIVNSHENEHYLAGFALHDDLTASTDLEEVTSNADVESEVGLIYTVFRRIATISTRWRELPFDLCKKTSLFSIIMPLITYH